MRAVFCWAASMNAFCPSNFKYMPTDHTNAVNTHPHTNAHAHIHVLPTHNTGIIKDTGFLMLTLRDLIGADRDQHAFFNVITTICRHCNEVMCLPS